MITIGGDGLQGWAATKQMIRATYKGLHTHTYVESVTVRRITFKSPPMVLNEVCVLIPQDASVCCPTCSINIKTYLAD